MATISKNKLVKFIRSKGESLTRDERADFNTLLERAKSLGYSEIQDVPRGTNEPEPKQDETLLDNVDEIEDESEAMFQRMRASIVTESTQQEQTQSDSFVSVDANINKTVETKTRKQRKGKTTNESFQLDGYILLMLVDMAFPTGIAMIFNMFVKDKTKKIDATVLSLKPDQQEKLQPLADKAAESLNFKTSPIASFMIMSSLMYASNLYVLKTMKR